ncbi:hypothetical protein HELRODRAFT_68781, partial [Helobdella robusta]|uniref:Palmitoyltransferase n=1 Tax=Helobdella robusta TaxID=6412 RepID=T1FZJ5_HELRO
MTVTRPIRKWEVFPGKNKFFCNGLIITTDQPSIFLLTNFLLFGVTALFYGFDCPYLFRKLSPSIPFVDVAVFIFVVIFLYKASFMDPGIIPRATPQEALYIERMMDFPQSGQSIAYQPPRILDITVKGVATKVKYCSTCKFFRPPRVSHCSTCDNCVAERFDHHCPWVGNCIGKRNYRFFYWFVITLTIHCCYVFAFSLTTMILISIESDFLNALKTSPGRYPLIVVSFVCLWSFVGLAGFHTFLSFCNITTNEDIKSSYTRGQKNPFSLDSKLSNFCFMIFGPVTPSLIDRRGFVKTD